MSALRRLFLAIVLIAGALGLAKKLFPGLKSIGTVWNTAEASSEACIVKAREVSRQLGVTLMEANVDNSSAMDCESGSKNRPVGIQKRSRLIFPIAG